ncbi:MAG: amidohydrolase family protein [Chloroflexi bacterium]|nr:amidohydrolase family protein [Chloroflexota bacterium]
MRVERTKIEDVRVVVGSGVVLEHQDVQIAEGRIAQVLPTARPGSAPDRTLLPGLINMHCHMTAPGGNDAGSLQPFRQQQELGNDVQLLRTLGNALTMLRSGVTTARDCGSAGRVSQTVRDFIGSGAIAGPRIVSCGRVITTSAGHGWQSGLRADNADEVRKAVRQLVEEGVDAIKVAVTGGGGTPGSNVFAAQYSREELETLVHEAHRLGKRVAAHANGTEGTRNAVLAGVDTVEHCGWMGTGGGLEVDEAVIEAMLERKTIVVPTMTVWYRAAYDDLAHLSPDRRKMRAVREQRTASWVKMYRRGVRFATGPDTGVNDTYWEDTAHELELMALHMQLSPLEAIRAATQDAAAGLGLEGEIGTITAGKRADILVVHGNPADDLGALRRVAAVYRDGAQVVREGDLLGP